MRARHQRRSREADGRRFGDERKNVMVAFGIKPSNDGPDRGGKGGRVDASQFEVDTPHGYR